MQHRYAVTVMRRVGSYVCRISREGRRKGVETILTVLGHQWGEQEVTQA